MPAPPPEAPAAGAAAQAREPEGGALRRTLLASERTYLAWWRTGLTAVAVGVGTGGVAPRLAGGDRWSYVGVGCGFAVLGVAFLAYGLRRQLLVGRAVAAGGFAPPDTRVLATLTAAGAVLGILAIVLLAGSL